MRNVFQNGGKFEKGATWWETFLVKCPLASNADVLTDDFQEGGIRDEPKNDCIRDEFHLRKSANFTVEWWFP